MVGNKYHKGAFITPIFLLILIIASIFTSATLVNLILSAFSPLSLDIRQSLMDAGLMVIILFPVMYFLVYEPLTSAIEDLNKSEKAIQESEAKFRSIVETTDDSIYLVNKKCEYLFMNAKHRSRMGILFDGEYERKAYKDFHKPQETRDFREKVDRVFDTGEPLQQEHRSQRDARYFLRTFSPIHGPHNDVVAVSIVSKDITKLRKESEAELRHSAIFEQSPYGIVIVDTKGNIIEFNETAHRELGYSKTEFAGLRIADIDPIQTEEQIRARMREVLNKGRAEFDVKHKTKGGDIRDVHVSTRVLDLYGDKYFQAIWQDITDRKRAEKELELYGQILAYMAEGVLLIRVTDGVIVYTNPKLDKMFGYDHKELVGHHVSLLNAPTDKSPEETAHKIMNALRQNGVWTGEILNIKKDGTPFWCHAVVSTFEHHMHGSVWISIHQEISDRKS